MKSSASTSAKDASHGLVLLLLISLTSKYFNVNVLAHIFNNNDVKRGNLMVAPSGRAIQLHKKIYLLKGIK